MNTFLPVLRTNHLFGGTHRKSWNDFFNDFFPAHAFENDFAWQPNIDITETEHEVVITAEVAGIKKENLDVTLTNGLLTIKGEKKRETDTKTENYKHIERHFGSFSRSFRISDQLNVEKVDATYQDGVLKVTIPKTEKTQPRKVTIQ